jgi:hypothetical protein
VLTNRGLPTLSTAQQLAHAARLMDEFNERSTTHRARVADRSRATSLSDQLDHQQHEILSVQPAPVPLRIEPPPMGDDAPHPLTGFVMDDETLGPHVWGVVLSAQVIERQFVPGRALEAERYWGPLAVDRRRDPPFATAHQPLPAHQPTGLA